MFLGRRKRNTTLSNDASEILDRGRQMELGSISYDYLISALGSPSIYPLVLIVAVTMILFSPLFIPTLAVNSISDAMVVGDTLQSDQHWVALVSTTIITALMIIDFALDSTFRVFLRDGNISFILMASAIVIHDIITFSVTIPYGNLQIFWCCWNARDYIVGSSFWLFLHQYGGSIWRLGHLSSISILLFSIGIIARTFSRSMLGDLSSSWGLAAIVTFIFLFFILLSNGLLYAVTRTKWEGTEYNCAIYTIIFLVLIAAFLALAAGFDWQSLYNLSPAYLVSSMYTMQVCVLVIATFNKRLKEIEMKTSAAKILEIKQVFVRYVSHEIRSPLQIIYVALQMIRQRVSSKHRSKLVLLKQLLAASPLMNYQQLLSQQVDAIYEVISESRQACDLSCIILNCLLDEQDVMTMDFSMTKATTLIKEAVDIYFLFAKAAGVGFELRYQSSALQETYVNVDLPKLKQVIGNLLSNAIKFSDKGSSITVTVSFVARGAMATSDIDQSDQSSSSRHSVAAPRKAADILRRTVAFVSHASRSVTSVSKADSIRIEVRDKGCGISFENQRKLFKNVVQFNPNKTQRGGGSGIGLFMSYGIVKKHRGRMGVNSPGEGAGKGSTFWMEIPVCDAGLGNSASHPSPTVRVDGSMSSWLGRRNSANVPPSRKGSNGSNSDGCSVVPSRRWTSPIGFSFRALQSSANSSKPRSSIPPRSQGSQMQPPNISLKPSVQPRLTIANKVFVANNAFRVLCVDDVPGIRKLVSRVLVNNQICDCTEEAADGEEALQKIKTSVEEGRPYDLLLMDFMMPKMDGPTAAGLAREAGFKGLIFGLTGNALSFDVDKFKSAGADEVLIKPMQISELKRLLRMHEAAKESSVAASILKAQRLEGVVNEGSDFDRVGGLSRTRAVIRVAIGVGATTIFFLFFPLWYTCLYPTILFDDDTRVESISYLFESRDIVTLHSFSLTITLFVSFEVLFNYFAEAITIGNLFFSIIIPALLIHDIVLVAYIAEYRVVSLFRYFNHARDYAGIFSLIVYVYEHSRDVWSQHSFLTVILLDSFRFIFIYVFPVFFGPQWILAGAALLAISVVLKSYKFIEHGRLLRMQPKWLSSDFCVLVFNGLLIVIDVGMSIIAFSTRHRDYVFLLLYMCFAEASILIAVLTVTRFSSYERTANMDIINSKRTLVRHVSHEIRTPLSIVFMGSFYLKDSLIKDYESCVKSLRAQITANGGVVDTVRSRMSACENTTQVLQLLEELEVDIALDKADVSELEDACSDAISVLNDLLTYEKLEAKLLALELTNMSVTEVVRNSVESLTQCVGRKGGSLRVVLDESISTSAGDEAILLADATKVSYALSNLMKYAVNLYPEGARLTAYVSLQELDGAVMSTDSSRAVQAVISRSSTKYNNRINPSFVSNRDASSASNQRASNRSNRGGGDRLSSRFSVASMNSDPCNCGKSVLHLRVAHKPDPSKNDTAIRFENVFSSLKNGEQIKAETLNGNFEHNLGLYVCDGIIRLHAGTFNVVQFGEEDSTDFQFITTLPIEEHADGEQKPQTASNSLMSPPSMMRTIARHISSLPLSSTPDVQSCRSQSSFRSSSIAQSVKIEDIEDVEERDEEKRDNILKIANTSSGVTNKTVPFTHLTTVTGANVGDRERVIAVSPLSTTLPSSILDRAVTRRVLCVDDSAPSLRMVSKVLVAHQICDAAPDFAYNGQEAVDMITISMSVGTPYDLVLIDANMPVLCGPKATKVARDSGFRGLIFGLTGDGLDGDINNFKASGAEEVLLKPLDITLLKSLVVRYETLNV